MKGKTLPAKQLHWPYAQSKKKKKPALGKGGAIAK